MANPPKKKEGRDSGLKLLNSFYAAVDSVA